MFSALLVDATDLDRWAKRRDAQALLPRFVRRLIHATTEWVLRIGFPAGEGVQLGGWDGIVAIEQGNAFVPDGTSAWELTTRHDTAVKADDDYQKRTRDPRGIDPSQSTFVFVTVRRWGGKDAWVNARQREGVWLDVRAYDADDLEGWLELAPIVHVWISILLGKHPEGAIDVGNFWADWSEATRPPTSTELVLSGRSEVIDQVHAWLREPSALPLTLQAESRDEALAVFAAAVMTLPPEEQVAKLSRAVVVRDLAAWQHLTATEEPLILVPTFDAPEAIGNATRRRHRVVIPLGRADSVSDKSPVVPRLSRQEAEKALVASGVGEDQARDLAVLARRSLMAFRRKLALSPATQQPTWARPSEARSLLPAMLAGAWSDGKTSDRDRQTLSTLAQTPYETMVEALVRWSHEADPPVRRIGDVWYIVSKEDAWYLLGRYLTRSDLECFEQVVLEVLGTPDPTFDLPEDQRWMAGALGHSPAHSGLLRAGLADTLAMLGARGETVAVGMGMSARDYAARIARRFLQQANGNWRLWASISRFLPLLAEAAPDAFLAAVEEGLSGAQPVLLSLFSESENPLFGSSPHTGLLWALQTLAWSPEHLGRVALLLARLGSIDTRETVSKRAQNTLCEIFLPWHPQTAATLEQRLRVLDSLRERQPAVAWDLLVALLPESYGIAFNTPKPRWRDWGSDCSSQILRREHLKAIGEIVTRILEDVGTSGPCWRNLIEALGSLPMDQHEAVVEKLSRIDAAGVGTSDRTEIWNALRKLISHHRSFPNADWALPKGQVDRLDELYRRFEPQELSARYGWLFSQTPELPKGEDEDWEARHQAISDDRLQAARAVYGYSGAAGLLELARCVQLPFELGMTLGRSELLETEEDELLCEHLAAEDAANAQFAAGLATGRFSTRGREWAEAKLATLGSAWSPAQRAQLLACLPADPRTWDLAENSDKETERRYWCLVYPFLIDRSGNVEHAVRKLLEHGRPFSAVEFLAFAVRDEQRPSDTLGYVLSGSPPGPDGMWPHPAVCDVIEDAASGDLERGFELGLCNSRGFVARDLAEGGKQERLLTERYEKFAAMASDRWPRAAAMLRRIADQYRAEGRREDQESEIEQDLS